MQFAFDVRGSVKGQKNYLAQMEDALVKNVGSFTLDEFTRIANIVGFSATDQEDDTIYFNKFLVE